MIYLFIYFNIIIDTRSINGRRVEFESLDVIGRQHRSPFCLLAFSYFPSYLDDVYVVLIYSGSCSPSVAACLLLPISLSLSLFGADFHHRLSSFS